MLPKQRFTIFADDGITPILGSAILADGSTDGTQYIVTSNSYEVAPGGTCTITAQLADSGNFPVNEPGHVVTWSKTGSGGSFGSPTSITNASGIATVTFTVSSVLDTEHFVTATDENSIVGTNSLRILCATDGLTEIRAIGSWEFILDAISGMTGNGTNLTSFSDLSGNNRVCTIGNAPLFTATKWSGGGGKPALQFVRTSTHYLKVLIPLAIAQPYTYVSVLDGYAGDIGTGNQNIMNGSGGISYRVSGSDRWSLFSGTPVNSNIVNSASTGKVIRFDVFNGASSKVYRGTTDGGTINPGTGSIAAAEFGIGARNDGVDPSNVAAAPFFGVIKKALNTSEMATIISFMQNRYPGLSGT